jgi:hypothetical protein
VEINPAARHPTPPAPPSVIVVLADGVRPDTLADALDAGQLPAMARLRDEGTITTLTSCFPTVTGPAYAPILMGRFPGSIGVPGLRWYDRARSACGLPDYARSYVGYQVDKFNSDLDPAAPTIWELTGANVGAITMITRGLDMRRHVGIDSLWSGIRAAYAHFTGNVGRAFDIDREVRDRAVRLIAEHRPEFAFVAFGTPDKSSHALGHRSPRVREALQIVDSAVARIREDAERDGRWETMHLWVTSDHGHSPVTAHEDLVGIIGEMGYRAFGHPWTVTIAPDVAVMVSGNAMAHLYVGLESRERPYWPAAGARWSGLAAMLLDRPSVDLVLLPTGRGAIVVSAARGQALVSMTGDRFSYERRGGDPLGLGADLLHVDGDEARAATMRTDYPDGVVQIALAALAPRAGDIILSASRNWDFRAKYEPINHVSSHGALHREHMLVPLLTNRPLTGSRPPARTVDVMPSALAVLGKPIPSSLDGRSFMAPWRP